LLIVDGHMSFDADTLFGLGYGSYDELMEDPGVDVVYVATPHAQHEAVVLRAIEAGKHVLCEKPFAINEQQVVAMTERAHARHRFLMEAMWTRFLPAYVELRALVADGRIGEVRMVTGSFGYRAPFDPDHRLFAAALGGGALLDVGVYPVQLALMLLGEPERVFSVADIGTTGVDEQIAVTMGFGGGQVAVAEAALRTNLACTARISGTAGAVELPAFLHCPAYLDVQAGVDTARVPTPMDGNGLHYQAAEVHRGLRAGRLESPIMPLADSRRIARTLDRARAHVGLVYPCE
jgi:predicted dehydrogenase